MTQGATAQLVFPGRTPQDVLAGYERALAESGFEVRERKWTGQYWHSKARLGSKAKAYLVRKIVPFGELTKSGNRLGAEAQVYAWGNQAVLRVAVVPYMELFDRAEVMFLSQGIFEKLVDDGWCSEKLREILGRLQALGFPMPRPA